LISASTWFKTAGFLLTLLEKVTYQKTRRKRQDVPL